MNTKQHHILNICYNITSFFVCKYRCKTLENDRIDTLAKHILVETSENNKCKIHFIESNKNHIHMMIKTIPNINLSQLVNKLKSRTSYQLWKELSNEMSKYYWSGKWCWTRGYFISTTGNVSSQVLCEYILNQRKEE